MGTEIFNNYVVVFIGKCHGVGLKPRGIGDSHIIVDILHEDDENWFLSENGFSSYWMVEFIDLLLIAEKWMIQNAIEEKPLNKASGYKFRKTQLGKGFERYERTPTYKNRKRG